MMSASLIWHMNVIVDDERQSNPAHGRDSGASHNLRSHHGCLHVHGQAFSCGANTSVCSCMGMGKHSLAVAIGTRQILCVDNTWQNECAKCCHKCVAAM